MFYTNNKSIYRHYFNKILCFFTKQKTFHLEGSAKKYLIYSTTGTKSLISDQPRLPFGVST